MREYRSAKHQYFIVWKLLNESMFVFLLVFLIPLEYNGGKTGIHIFPGVMKDETGTYKSR